MCLSGECLCGKLSIQADEPVVSLGLECMKISFPSPPTFFPLFHSLFVSLPLSLTHALSISPYYSSPDLCSQTRMHTHTELLDKDTSDPKHTNRLADCHMRVSGPLSLQQQAPVSRQDDEPPDRNELCVCKQQAGGQREASQGGRGGR